MPQGVPLVEGGSANGQPLGVCRIVFQQGTYVGRLDAGRCLVGDTASAREVEASTIQVLYAQPVQLRWQGAAGGLRAKGGMPAR